MSEIFAIISIAFLSSFSHCYAMCGGFNLAFLKLSSKAKNPFFLNLLYHLSRIFAYVLLGILCGVFGVLLGFNAKIQSLTFFILGIFMGILGLALLFRGQILNFLEKNILWELFFSKLTRKAMHFKGVKGAVILGFCNGFVPCGLVYFFLANALSQSNITKATFIMLIFGISTLPSLLFFTYFSTFLKERLNYFFSIFASLLMIGYGIYLSFMGFKGFI
ncbi:sulfite exporter TauE/SafE family protein [Campylobacter helveticus]|uniref:Sulfite exporter TauE/SafE family protein n=1 Tax=Campylobacter helveticus TaxID=28898 RepID=A0AAX2UMP1_9BACT|nr:sulfite exporter TauE/SafE family protein [Campylobacter helveticus]ARE81291.1 putative membrane protein (DsbD domain) [Campylobacter helveticus]MCR2054586.1 sulfite exporter TauE/SafE family protein [Campylobacter helveticus]MCR2059385.1 sulfite exporter TauE/SafE family protein [Campylobacter helveticus]MCR2063611.1 sulfite exporter TauE/SafE family protein [Campylobacter helveticus]TNB55211.1 sulfite exporter TauE/SafE family protein [Campylobacter helveticus]